MPGSVGVGVLGASSWIYGVALRPAFAVVEGVEVVHEASGAEHYRACLVDPDVDLVYVPLPNHLHEPWVIRALEAGKHVLCEKPLGIDGASVRRMAEVAEGNGRHLVEAYMSPFHPRNEAVVAAVAAGAIGRLQFATARMCGVLPPDNHRWAVANGGGALLDVGIYCLEPMLFAAGWDGDPASVADVWAHSTFGPDGDGGAPERGTAPPVDRSTTASFTVGDASCAFHLSFDAADEQSLVLVGDRGTIDVARHATPDRSDAGFTVRRLDGSLETIPTDSGNCYEGMVAHARDLINGVAEPVRPPERSVALAVVMDRIATAAGHHR